MPTFHYIQGVHAVRINMDDEGVIDVCETFNPVTGDFDTDFSFVMRIDADHDTMKIPEHEFLAYCEQRKREMN